MKNKFTILVFVVFLVVLGIFVIKNKKTVEAPYIESAVSTIPTTGKYCFTRAQKATDASPYNVEEHIVLNFAGVKVSGTKTGTQSGPDMTNGYEGTLTGSTITNENTTEMELAYAYTIEGAKNRELEVYTFLNNNLVKKRWALDESKINGASILVPDYMGDPTLITYRLETCPT